MEFSKDVYYGYILKGNLPGAIGYVKQFPEQLELYKRFVAVYEQEQYAVCGAGDDVDKILVIYQRYYRDAFYLRIDREEAAEKLRVRLADFLGTDEKNELCAMEQGPIAEVFQNRGLHFLGGRTGGYYGPYVWRTTETMTCEVALPAGMQTYTIKLLDGFLSKSWLDVLSFGEISTGGWTDEDGIINCVKSSYDFESEDFQVSLLKHEAQHARDLAVYKEMSSEDLEYRAKLVELIYSRERNLLERFAGEADSSDKSNGHAAASHRIIEAFGRKLSLEPAQIQAIPIVLIQTVARELFEESDMWLRSSRGKSLGS